MASPVADNYSAASGFVMACGCSNSQAGTGLTLTNYLDWRVFQRVVGAKAIPVVGTYTGSPSLIEARAVDFTSGAAITAWTPIHSFPTGGNFSGSLTVPQGSWYRLQVRDGVNNSITDAGNTRFGVGKLIAMLGQSNMHLRPTAGNQYPIGDKRLVWFNTSNVFQRVGNINDAIPLNSVIGYPGYTTGYTQQASSSGDGFVIFGNLVAQSLNIPVCYIERAVSGSYISSWMTGGANWNDFVSAVTAAGGDFELAIWHQGENDAGAMSTATMKLRLADLHNQLKTLTGRNNTNFKLGIDGLGIGAYNGSVEGDFGKIRAAHEQFAAETAGVFYSTSAHDTHTSDGVHLHHTGYYKVGKREAKSYLAIMGNGTTASGPKIVSATRSGAVVTLNVVHAGGTTLSDGGDGSGTALTGFEVKVNGTPATISSTAITSNNTITLTLSTTPSGTVTVSYAMMNNPHSANSITAPTLASIVYDNATYYLSTIGCPLRPLAAITVT